VLICTLKLEHTFLIDKFLVDLFQNAYLLQWKVRRRKSAVQGKYESTKCFISRLIFLFLHWNWLVYVSKLIQNLYFATLNVLQSTRGPPLVAWKNTRLWLAQIWLSLYNDRRRWVIVCTQRRRAPSVLYFVLHSAISRCRFLDTTASSLIALVFLFKFVDFLRLRIFHSKRKEKKRRPKM
jgi:hypothetical protein